MKYYKVEFVERQKFVFDVSAETEEEARKKGYEAWHEAVEHGTVHYHAWGDEEADIDMVYDVTGTDDEPQEECCVCKESCFMYDLEKADNDKFICQKCKYLRN